jgi:purine-binding chemotaxis protein CheW
MSTIPAATLDSTADTARRPTDALVGKYLTFQIAQEEYGLPVLKVREIIKIMDITVVPQVPAHVRGVINLRGKVIPVVDLRLKFGFSPRDYDDRTCIIVVEVATQSSRLMMGVVVDAVSEVLNITQDELEETPDFGARVNADYIKAMAKVKGKVKILVDLDRVLAGDGGGF